jgi:hypothetical protein
VGNGANGTTALTPAARAGGPAKQLATQQKAWTSEQLERLIERAQQNDAAAMAELTRALTQAPELEMALSSIGEQVTRFLLQATAPENLLLRALWPKRLEELRRELAGPEPTPLERALVERVVTCYLAVSLAEIDALSKGGTPEQRDFYERRLERAHHRYTTAAVALARVRRLLAPVVQVNVAHAGAQQMNLAPGVLLGGVAGAGRGDERAGPGPQ